MKTWLVNTNSKEENGNPHAFKYMLRQNKASAFYSRGQTVDKIESGDLVLLYHNQNRVIAVGAVVTKFQGHDFVDTLPIEHWVDVNWLWKTDIDKGENPTDFIDRNKIGITMVNGTVINITDQVNYKELFAQIALKQNL